MIFNALKDDYNLYINKQNNQFIYNYVFHSIAHSFPILHNNIVILFLYFFIKNKD